MIGGWEEECWRGNIFITIIINKLYVEVSRNYHLSSYQTYSGHYPDHLQSPGTYLSVPVCVAVTGEARGEGRADTVSSVERNVCTTVY